MSRVYWHTRDHGEAELRGSERAYANGLALDIALGIAWPGIRAYETMASSLVDPPAYLGAPPVEPAEHWRWEESAKTWLRLDGRIMVDGEPMGFDDMSLNTLITMTRPLRLLAWVHGMCENHGYFEADAQPALIETIEEGRESNVLREDQGWEDVLDLLARLDGSGPVVWSYSACEWFPDRWELRPPRDPDESDEDYENRVDRHIYDEVSGEEAWDQCMKLLRKREWPVALHPDFEQGFVSGKTAFDFVAARNRELAET